ncbi:hypothetical protein H6G17_24465 [Chroococcidiopsis sp. FACHB-1243]|uniref:hypothetical protein n=1 Tax=Chroococcidiopsis sp. [FACHB-1243] TaxID=2692781 RepID=UPI0017874D9D|nr:hypothetical protein [Chroococcidiopsis sp. [FACHB-1243]]MBD2308629.1 hypothetical protein [Chroococcidiopsis sp. [FACHB-1243]]
MLFQTISLSLNLFLFLPILSNLSVETKNCQQLSNCSKQKIIVGRRTDNSRNSPPPKKTCTDEGKDYQEGEEIQRDGVKFICKDGKFVPRDE